MGNSCLEMVSNIISGYVMAFWENVGFGPIIGLWPPSFMQKYSKRYTKYKIVSTTIIFVNLRIPKLDLFGKRVCHIFGNLEFEILKLWSCEILRFENFDFLGIHHSNNMYSNNSLIYRLLIVHGSRLMAHASRLVAQGMAKKILARGPSSRKHWSMSLEPWANSH